ncbi:MAG TPA: undecaprenyl-diphosphate phosphatase [Solirubrobacteraceae bacterium]|nr:undecaprenyl-diphosphate phosphatase [Solirubrobacteraceae bacterium]
MDAFQAIVLGIVQGLTEFLPISSTAHLRVVPAFVGWDDPGAAFTAVTQLGTMGAVLVYFRHDLLNIARGWVAGLRDPEKRDEPDSRMGWYLIVGTIPIVVFGFAFADGIEEEARNLTLIGITLIALGLLLLLAERLADHVRDLDDKTWRDAVVIGFAQAAALVPGVSRSGATITAALFLGFNRAAAARFSFLLSVPAVVLSGLYQLRHIGGEGAVGFLPTTVATIFAFVSGYAAIAFLLRFLVRHTTAVFVIYRVILGAAVLVLAGADVIS